MIDKATLTVVLVVLSGCATLPEGPSVTSLPGTGKSFDEFRADDQTCRHYGYEQAGGVSPDLAANESIQRSAATGAVLGAVAGAAISGGHGAAIGAGTGLLFGSVAGTDAGYVSGRAVQRRYDSAYVQCMYAKGNKVPVSRQVGARMPRPYYPPPPPGVRYAPPDADEIPPSARGYGPPPDFYPPPPPSPRPRNY